MAKEVVIAKDSTRVVYNYENIAREGQPRSLLSAASSIPHPETYRESHNRVYVSSKVSENEIEENTRMGKYLQENLNEDVYVLPTIDPSGANAYQLRREYFPRGVKEGKNPDFYIRGRFVDAKTMMDKPYLTAKQAKRKIQDRLKDAFGQADDCYIEIPLTYSRALVEQAVRGQLKSSSHTHIVYVNHGGTFFKIE